MISINQRATAVARRLIAQGEELGVTSSRTSAGAWIIDTGIEVEGSLEAGRLFAEACMGDLGSVAFRQLTVGGLVLPGVEVTVRHPVTACMAGQYAGWAVNVEGEDGESGYFAMGSGPARALYRGEPLFQELSYRDEAEEGLLALETGQLPPAPVADWVAGRCGIQPHGLYLLAAPTASLVGSVQIAARVVETGLHKLHEVGFDIEQVLSGFGSCPLAPIAADDFSAIGRTNDAVLYGGRAWYTVRCDDGEIEEVLEKLPSAASRDYGTPFADLLRHYGGDFYEIDPLLFSPAEVTLNNLASGRTFHAGDVNAELLATALAL